jgi:hypothetical protein
LHSTLEVDGLILKRNVPAWIGFLIWAEPLSPLHIRLFGL